MLYDFENGIYPSGISYVNPYSMYQFFGHPITTKAFLNYLFFRIKEEHKKIKKDDFHIRFVAVIENDKASTIDIEYNFFVNILGEWIEHYSSHKTIIHEYPRIHTFKEKDEFENEIIVRKKRIFKYDFSVREKVMFDYVVDGWLVGDKFHKRCRYDFLHTFLNNMVFSKLVWINLKTVSKFRTANHYYLLQDLEQKNTYVKFQGVQFLKDTLKKNIGNSSLNMLKKMGANYKKVTSQNVHVTNKINSLKEEGIEVKFYQPFDINMFEKTKDLGDGKWHRFVANEDEYMDEYMDEIDEIFDV
ncbi:MAG: hypothetical protein WC656_01200 [Sulfurimonas sp.]|jgi:hypothetical protein